MLVGKSHKIIPLMEKLQTLISMAYRLSLQCVVQPTTINAIEVRTAIEHIQYEVDQIALKDAQSNP